MFQALVFWGDNVSFREGIYTFGICLAQQDCLVTHTEALLLDSLAVTADEQKGNTDEPRTSLSRRSFTE